MRRNEGRAKLLGLAVMAAMVGVVGLEGCDSSGGSCGDGPPNTLIPLPSGEHSPASGEIESEGSGSAYLSSAFPHGAHEAWPSESSRSAGYGGQLGSAGATSRPPPDDSYYSDYGTGAYIPSAKLVIDRQGGIVTRSYRDERGRHVVETWRIEEAEQ